MEDDALLVGRYWRVIPFKYLRETNRDGGTSLGNSSGTASLQRSEMFIASSASKDLAPLGAEPEADMNCQGGKAVSLLRSEETLEG